MNETPSQAVERLKREGKLRQQSHRLVNFAELAQKAIAAAKESGVLAAKKARREAEEQAGRHGKIAAYLQHYLSKLPADYRRYVREPPPKTAGNREALSAAERLTLGRSLHLYGDSGATKSHIAIWTGARLIREHCIPVRYYHVRDLLRAFRDWENELEVADYIRRIPALVIDDIDKDNPSRYNRSVIYELYCRLEDSATLITTANRRNDELAELWGGDAHNILALASRMALMQEVGVTGPDHRPIIAAARNNE